MFTKFKFIIFFFILLTGSIAGCEVKDVPAIKSEDSHQGIRNDAIEYDEKLSVFKQVKGEMQMTKKRFRLSYYEEYKKEATLYDISERDFYNAELEAL
ncbi:hypothetical protein ACQVPJ_22265 [Bacillus mycoides]|uniref:Lipoprotein n=1 Tax=Bacillus cereus VD021 TaxID=1053224 RepID=R8HG47_BACCE|nr:MULTISPECIES: hypothetical protein [Bacillus cereus group]EOO71761.1 hypothetical protein IIC_04277 [Bacillus cereus VD021]MCQ6568893.1 hypothetical protein [Bacillus mycoides]